MTHRFVRIQTIVMRAVVLAATCALWASNSVGEPATPQRPSVSTDASLTAYRSFEVEAGYVTDDTDYADVSTKLKFGVTRNAELFVSWLPFVDTGSSETGPGDLIAATRVRAFDQNGSRPAGAYQLAASLPTGDGDKGLGSGEVDFLSTWIASWSLGRHSLTANYQLNVPGGDAGVEHGFVAALGSPLVGSLSGFAELSAIVQPQQDIEVPLLTLGLGYALRPAVVLDAGAYIGLGAEAADFGATVGLTANLGGI